MVIHLLTLTRNIDDVALDVATFLREALQAHQQPHRDDDQISILINHVDSDQFSPLRELAPSRAALLLDHRNRVQPGSRTSRALVFSILLFRLVTFNSDALKNTKAKDRQTHFETLGEWKTYLAILKGMYPDEKNTFFCNKSAYGRGQSRTIDHADRCWSTSDIITQHLQGLPFPAPFTAVGVFIQGLKAAMLPLAGSLVQILILGDLVYAGAVAMPTAQETEGAVRKLKMGGYDALEMLGIPLSPDKAQSSFVDLYHALNSTLSTAEKEAMKFDTIMLEHTLCKIKRCRTYKGITRAGAYMKKKAKEVQLITQALKRKSSTTESNTTRAKRKRTANLAQ